MKKRIVMFLAAAMAAIGAWADEETVGGYTWTYQINGDTATIHKGSYSAAISPSPTGALTIPTTLGGKTVTSIGSYAFYGCSGLTSVTIPNSVTSIGYDAFENCRSLTSVTIPNSVTNIGEFAFSCCRGLTSVTIPDCVTSIKWGVFSYCSGLTSVTIPNNVTNIEASAFSECNGIRSVTVPQCVCSSKLSTVFPVAYQAITNVVIVDGVTSTGERTFDGCTNLTSVTIPNSVTNIGDHAFNGCSGLTSVTIPDSVTSIGDSAFEGCSGLTSMPIPSSVTNIGECAFSGCSGLTSVTIPSSVTNIGECAFSGCSGLTSVTIPDSVASIEDWAFVECSGLTNITVGVGNLKYMSRNGLLLTKDGKILVQGVNGNVTIPNSVTSIRDYAFYGCGGLTSVTIPDSVISIGNWAFCDCSGLTSVTIDNGVTSIGVYAFYGCSGLTSVTIPDSVISIGDGVFGNCSGLTCVSIPNGVTTIGEVAFCGCSGLTSVTIGNSVTSIGEEAFCDCGGLTSVTIPNSVTSIGAEAFCGCSGLTSVYVSPGDADRVRGLIQRSRFDVSGVRFIELDMLQVVFNANGGSVDESSRSVASGSAVGALPMPTRSGYTFDGWFTAASGGNSVSASTKVTANVTYYAHWIKNATPTPEPQPTPVSHMVTFNANGGTVSPATKTVESGTAVGTLPTPVAEGYEFLGWFTAKTGGAKVTASTKVTANVTYYAHWQAVEDPNTLWDEDEAFDADAAATFDGFLVKDYEVQGLIQVKVGKANKKTGVAKATAKVTLIGLPAKLSYKGVFGKPGASDDFTPGVAMLSCNGQPNLELRIGRNALWGEMGGYEIEGSRNVFARGGDPKAAALSKWQGAYTLVLETVDAEGAGSSFAWGYSGLTVSVGAKGKVKVQGTMVDGSKVNVASQLLVGDERCCVPVVVPLYSKKGGFGLNLWLQDDGTVEAGEISHWDASASKTPFLAWFGEEVPTARTGAALPGTLSFMFLGEPESDSLEPLYDYLPWEVVFTTGSRWSVPAAGNIKYDREAKEWYDAKESANPAGLKLTYVSKTGTFKGTFKFYAVDSAGRLKKLTANVSGVMVGKRGYGTATVKNVGSWPVSIE